MCFFYSTNPTKPLQMLKFHKNTLISFENVCVIKNKSYICTQITTTKLLSLKNKYYENCNILHLEHKN